MKLALVLSLFSALALAQGQPGRPSRGSTAGGGGVSATAVPIVSVGPTKRCVTYNFWSGNQMGSNAVGLGIYEDSGDGYGVDSSVQRTTASASAYAPRRYCFSGAGANRQCTRFSNQLFFVQTALSPWSTWFRWTTGPSGMYSSSYLGVRPTPTSAVLTAVACGGLQPIRNAVYVGCATGFGAQVACVNGNDDSPTCIATGFSCTAATTYDVTFTYEPSSASIVVRVQDLNSGAAFTNTFPSDLPAEGTVLGYAYSACSGPDGTGLPANSLAYACITTE